MVISIDSYKRVDLDLSTTGGITQEYSLNNNLSYETKAFFHLFLIILFNLNKF